MWLYKKENWVFIGHFCEGHLAMVAKNYGSTRAFTLNKESVETDRRCMMMGCKNLIDFAVERLVGKDE